MRNGMMRKVPEKRRGYAAGIGLLVAVVVTLFQPLPALASCTFTVSGELATLLGVTTITIPNCSITTGPGHLASVTLAPPTTAGGAGVTGEVRLSSPAPWGGLVVTLSDNGDVATVPASVTVAAGATTASFTVTTVPVTVFSIVAITATVGEVSRAAPLLVLPPEAR